MLKALSYLYLMALTAYLLLYLSFGDGFWWLSLANTFAAFLFIPLILTLLIGLTKRARLLLFWTAALSLVALFWFGPYFLPKNAAEASGQVLKVVTYNIRNEPLNLEPWLHESQPDLVLLQETPSGFAEQLQQNLHDLYPYLASQDETWGNAALSRYPITATYDLLAFDRLVPLKLELDVSGRTLSVFNVHLVNPVETDDGLFLFNQQLFFSYDDRVRNQQLKLLINLLEQEKNPYLVAGDFNLSQFAAHYHKLSNIAKDSFREAGWGWGNSWPVSSAIAFSLPLPLVLRLDYIWHSSDFATVDAQLGPALGSDHLPLTATLTWPD